MEPSHTNLKNLTVGNFKSKIFCRKKHRTEGIRAMKKGERRVVMKISRSTAHQRSQSTSHQYSIISN